MNQLWTNRSKRKQRRKNSKLWRKKLSCLFCCRVSPAKNYCSPSFSQTYLKFTEFESRWQCFWRGRGYLCSRVVLLLHLCTLQEMPSKHLRGCKYTTSQIQKYKNALIHKYKWQTLRSICVYTCVSAKVQDHKSWCIWNYHRCKLEPGGAGKTVTVMLWG